MIVVELSIGLEEDWLAATAIGDISPETVGVMGRGRAFRSDGPYLLPIEWKRNLGEITHIPLVFNPNWYGHGSICGTSVRMI